MNVKKSVLEQKTDKQLEEYIKLESRFVPEAVKYAFEILQSRGKEFSNDDIERINSLINFKNPIKELIIHKNHIRSSNFLFASVGLGVINIFLSHEILNSGFAKFIVICTLAFLIGLGLLIRKGSDWLKYLFLALMIFGLFGLPFMIQNMINNPIVGIINILQTILQLLSLVFLFMIPKKEEIE